MTPSDRYWQVRESCMKSGKTVPNKILRAHLDFAQKVQRNAKGLRPVVITITKNVSLPILDMFPNGIDGSDIIVRVEGQKFGPNAI